MNNFPPQAYTRDTLSAAYEWLRDQPGSIRELAQDSDSLVALFLQSRRRPAGFHQPIQQPMPQSTAQNQSLASAENFKEDLKVLARGLKQFESSKVQFETTKTTQAASMPTAHSVPTTPAPVSASHTITLDAKSLTLIVEVQKRLNLSSPNEALRMIIAVGADRVRDILPKNP